MPLWVAEFVNKTTGLNAQETGAYLMLIMSLWSHDGRLPEDHRKLQRIARCGREWPRVWDAISGFFVVSDGWVTQERVTEELQKVRTKREVNAHNGARGGRAKALKMKESDVANATISLKQSESESNIREKTPRKPPKGGGYSDAFEEWWSLYPRKVGKGAAWRAWERKRREFGEDAIFSALRAQLANGGLGRVDGRNDFRPHPATWLNGERFNDPTPERQKSTLEKMQEALDADDRGAKAGPEGEIDHPPVGRLSSPVLDAAPARHGRIAGGEGEDDGGGDQLEDRGFRH